jgi:hypothetical protein
MDDRGHGKAPGRGMRRREDSIGIFSATEGQASAVLQVEPELCDLTLFLSVSGNGSNLWESDRKVKVPLARLAQEYSKASRGPGSLAKFVASGEPNLRPATKHFDR